MREERGKGGGKKSVLEDLKVSPEAQYALGMSYSSLRNLIIKIRNLELRIDRPLIVQKWRMNSYDSFS